MAPTTFTLLSLGTNTSLSLLNELKALAPTTRPLWLGQCHHWIHLPTLSSAALNGPGPLLQTWDYLVITPSPLPALPAIAKIWSITAPVDDNHLASLAAENTRRATATPPPQPEGWSVQDLSALDAAIPPADLEASLAMTSHSMGSPATSKPLPLKDFIPPFATSSPGPIYVFNLLAYHPSQRPRYFQYVAAFQESVGIKYGGEPVFIGFGVDEKEGHGVWEDTALIYYPSVWHFGKMLDDEGYMDVDRRFKQGVLRDNPLMCCTEVKLE